MRGIHWSPVNSPHKGQWRGALMLSSICAWINGWVNNRDAGDLRRHRAHYDVTVMCNYILTRVYTLIVSNALELDYRTLFAEILYYFILDLHCCVWNLWSTLMQVEWEQHRAYQNWCFSNHYTDVTMDSIASQITSLTIVYSAVYSGADQRKHQSSASLAFLRGIHRGPVNSPH